VGGHHPWIIGGSQVDKYQARRTQVVILEF